MTVDIQLMVEDVSLIPPDQKFIRVKIRKVIKDESGKFIIKAGLSKLTGEWIQVFEGQVYPDECIFQMHRQLDYAPDAR